MIEVKIEVVKNTVGAGLEVINTERGIEVVRQRVAGGEAIAYELGGNHTCLLHEVQAPESPIVDQPGNLVHGDIDPSAVAAPDVKNFKERMADLEEFYDSASVALHEVHEVLADTIHDDATKLLLIEEILDHDVDELPVPLETGDYEAPLDGAA